jgi:hypothetical protein
VGTNSKRHQNDDENISKHKPRERASEDGSMVLCQSRQAQDTIRHIKILYIMAIQSKARTDYPQHPQHITSRRSHRYELGMKGMEWYEKNDLNKRFAFQKAEIGQLKVRLNALENRYNAQEKRLTKLKNKTVTPMTEKDII